MDLTAYRFPLFFDLNEKKVVIIGGGKVALRRAVVLLSFGARVTIIAPECEAVPENAVFFQRPYEKGDLAGAFLAVAATSCREVNYQVGQEARQAGIFVSVADCKEESTFFFPAVCTGSGLVAGVVSQGEEHKKTAAAARKIRTLLEELDGGLE